MIKTWKVHSSFGDAVGCMKRDRTEPAICLAAKILALLETIRKF